MQQETLASINLWGRQHHSQRDPPFVPSKRLPDWASLDALEKEMETHSSVLAWRIPGTGEPGVLKSMGSQRVGHY